MTPAYMLPPKEVRKYRFSYLRVIIMSLMLFLLTSVCLYLHNILMTEFVSYLTTAEKKTTSFLAEQFSYMLPFLTIAVFQYAVYAKHDNRDGILQKEQAYEILLLALLVYLVLLPYVWNYSNQTLTLQLAAGIEVTKNAGREYETLFLDIFQWFLRLSVPLILLFTYHRIRASVEIRETAQAAAAAKTDAQAEITDAQAEITVAHADVSAADTDTASVQEPISTSPEGESA